LLFEKLRIIADSSGYVIVVYLFIGEMCGGVVFRFSHSVASCDACPILIPGRAPMDRFSGGRGLAVPPWDVVVACPALLDRET
jgi:hypothetical protein